eukprot:4244990-Ditylum_brightwellii.AAC.1
MIRGGTKLAKSPCCQEKSNIKTHICKEVLKWQGTSYINNTVTGLDDSAPKIVKGSTIIKKMILSNSHLILVTLDPHITEGPSFKWFHYHYGKHTKLFDASNHNLG